MTPKKLNAYLDQCYHDIENILYNSGLSVDSGPLADKMIKAMKAAAYNSYLEGVGSEKV